MANAHDKAHELAAIIEQEENYQTVKELTSKVMQDEQNMMKIENFRRSQFELQQKQMQGQQLQQEELEETNRLYEELSQNAEIKRLLEAEEKLSMLFADINRILTGPLEKIYKKD